MFSLVVVLLLSALKVTAQACNVNTPCPASAPCCSEYGFCGSGPQYCLGGCNPLFSNTLDSCKPNAVCKSQTYTFDKSRILADSSKFDGNPDTYDWIVDGGNFDVVDNNLVMILTETNAGTRLSSTRYIHYGKISATLKTGRWNGVVVGFITMSNIRDEIDWEFPGNRVTQGQTNFFWEGINSHGAVTPGLTDTYENYHTYTIDWSADALVFQIDGQTVRTLKASDYMSNGVSQYPNTPSRIQLSLWPAGTSTSAQGTIDWAGGMINWQDPDYLAANNQFRTYIESISVECADSPSAGQVSYVYATGSTPNKAIIELSDESPIIGSGTTTTSSSSTSTSTSSTSSSSSSSSSTKATTTSSSTTTSSQATTSSTTSSQTTITTVSSSSSSTDVTTEKQTGTTTSPSSTGQTSSQTSSPGNGSATKQQHTSSTGTTTATQTTAQQTSSLTSSSTSSQGTSSGSGSSKTSTTQHTQATTTTGGGIGIGSGTSTRSTSSSTATGISNTSGPSMGGGNGVNNPPPPPQGSQGQSNGNGSQQSNGSGSQQSNGQGSQSQSSASRSSTSGNTQPTSGSNTKSSGTRSLHNATALSAVVALVLGLAIAF